MAKTKTEAAHYRKLLVRLPEDMLQHLHECADDEFESVNTYILRGLRAWMATHTPRQEQAHNDLVHTGSH